jgi:hypothetical protein
MLKLTTDLVVLLCVLGSTAVVLLGWGNLTWRVLGVPRPTEVSVITIWLGFCIVVGCLEFIHLFVPIDWRVTVGVTIVGLLGQAGLFKSKATVLEPKALDRSNAIGLVMIAMSAVQRYPWRSLAAVVVIVTWCLRAMETPTMYDSGLYHFGSIRWLNEYPIVPGLGNLHWRLALNQSYFGFLALLNIAPFWGKGYATGGLFLLLLTAFTLLEVSITRKVLWRLIFGGILFSYLCLLSGMIANPLPDTAVSLVQIAIFVFLFCNLNVDTESEPDAYDQLKRLQVLLVFLSLTIVTIKLSSLGFAAGCLTIIAVSMFRSASQQVPTKLVTGILAIVGFFALIHIGRSYLLSGAPFFPSPIAGVWSLPWAVEFGVAHNESQLIYAWAKQPGIALPNEVPSGYGWLNSWLLALPSTLKYLFVASSLMFLVAGMLQRLYSGYSTKQNLLLAAPIFMALGFWFFTAPDPRFLGATGVLYFAWSLWFFYMSLANFAQRSGGSVAKVQDVLKYFSAICALLLFTRWSLIGLFLPFGWSALPVAETALQANPSGLKAFVPSNGSQCWNSELPCAVLLHGGLLKVPFGQLGWLLSLQGQRFGLFIQR